MNTRGDMGGMVMSAYEELFKLSGDVHFFGSKDLRYPWCCEAWFRDGEGHRRVALKVGETPYLAASWALMDIKGRLRKDA